MINPTDNARAERIFEAANQRWPQTNVAASWLASICAMLTSADPAARREAERLVQDLAKHE